MRFQWFGILTTCIISVSAAGQDTRSDKMDFIYNTLEMAQELSEEPLDLTQLTEELTELINHPLNLNKATATDLQGLIFIHSILAHRIVDYRISNGEIKSYSELLRIDGISPEMAQTIKHFTVLELNKNNISTSSKTEVALLSLHQFPKPKGFQTASRAYTGPSGRQLFRIKSSPNSTLKAGLLMEKDSGEKLKPDFTSGYLEWSPKQSIFTKVILGDFHINYAQNLLIGPNFSLGKSLHLGTWFRTSRSTKANSSSAEYGFRRGVVGDWKHHNFSGTVFVSLENLDVSTDINKPNISGLHRTDSELERRHNSKQFVWGLLNERHWKDATIGFGLISGKRSSEALNQEQLFNLLSINAKYRLNKGMVYAEAVNDLNKNLTAVNAGLIVNLASFLDFAMVYRNYPHTFHNPFSSALSSQSQAKNETGFLTGFEWKLSSSQTLNTYIDHYAYAEEAELPSFNAEKTDLMVQWKWMKKRNWELYIRYRERIERTEAVDGSSQRNIRGHYQLHLTSELRLSQRLEYAFNKNESGMLFYTDLQWRPKQQPWAVDIRYALFDTDNYDQRIYAYEAALPYSFSIPAYSNTGKRSYIKLRYKGFKQTSIWVYYAIWSYKNLQQISSGNNLIDGNKKSELGFTLRYRL